MSAGHVRETPGFALRADDRLQLSSAAADSARGVAPNSAASKEAMSAPAVGAPPPGAGWFARIRSLFRRKPRMRRVAIALCTYDEAQGYLDRGFTLAPEEDTNNVVGLVWLEKLEPVK